MPVRVEKSPFERAAHGQLTTGGADSNVGSRVEKGWIDTFLSAIMQGASVTHAAEQAKIHVTLPYKTRTTDEAFKRAWLEAADIGTEFMEQEAARRAYHGTLKPVFHKGVECGQVREYSDTLMIFLLKARRPDKYREGVDDVGRGNFVLNINVETVAKGEELQIIEMTPAPTGEESDGEKHQAGK